MLFIVSQPRSGSTLLQSLVSNNPYVATATEPWLLLPFLSILKPDIVQASYNYRVASKSILRYMKFLGGEEVFIEKLRSFLNDLYVNLKTPETRYILDKTPRYYEILPEIKKVFPDAKFIILKRNPFSVLSSIITSFDKSSFYQLNGYSRDILDAPQLIQSFVDDNKDNPNIMEVSYENLVQNPELEVGKLYHWLNIPFSPEVLNYANNDKYRGGFNDPKNTGHKNRPVIDRLNIWKEKLEDPHWKNFFYGYSYFLGEDFLKKYGNYESISDKSSREFDIFKFSSKVNLLKDNQLSNKTLLKYILLNKTKIKTF